MIRAVIYARYSSDGQREESIEGQIRVDKEYIDRNGMTLTDIYIDKALTASKEPEKRLDFQRMIRNSAKDMFDVVVVYKLDRFARSRDDSRYYKKILKKHNVKVVSATQFVADDPSGIIFEGMLESMDEYYSANLSENINRGLMENALKGKNSGQAIPLGYMLGDDDKLVIDPLTAALVIEIFQRFAEGESIYAIIRSFTERGLKNKKNKPFTYNSFSKLLRNRKYIGEYAFKGVVIPGGVPAIVSEALFNVVQERINKNKNAPGRAKYTSEEEYLLTTKLFCGKCERMMVGEAGTSKTGKVHHYYKCNGTKRHKDCDLKPVKKDWIENVVIDFILKNIFVDNVIEKIAKAVVEYQKEENTSIALLERQKKEIDKSLNNLLKALEAGIFSVTTKERLDELEKQKEANEIALIKEKARAMSLTENDVIAWMHDLSHGDINSPEYRRQLIDCFVNRVVLYEDRLVMTFNTSNSTSNISFDLIQSSDLDTPAPPEHSNPNFSDLKRARISCLSERYS